MRVRAGKPGEEVFEGWLVWRGGRFEVLVGKLSEDDDYDGIIVLEPGDLIKVVQPQVNPDR